MPATLFVSDLHLPAGPCPLRDTFDTFLKGPARSARAVYLLGDVFESWVGDDLGCADYAREVDALRTLAVARVPVYFQHGNRDFLVGRDFGARSGVQILPDPSTIELDGARVLVSHGDLWCTDDLAYQRWRRLCRQRWLQGAFVALPASWRRRIAGGVRSGADAAKRGKAMQIMDVNPAAVSTALRRSGVHTLVHGHTHRPGRYPVDLGGGETAERLVLPDWRPETCAYLQVEAGDWRVIELLRPPTPDA